MPRLIGTVGKNVGVITFLVFGLLVFTQDRLVVPELSAWAFFSLALGGALLIFLAQVIWPRYTRSILLLDIEAMICLVMLSIVALVIAL